MSTVPAMFDLLDTMVDSIFLTLSEKIDPSILKKVDSKKLRHKLIKNLMNEAFYYLIKNKKITLAPGFGSVVLRPIKEKNKKIFDRASKTMVVRRVKGSKVVYIPGDTLKEFL